MQDILDQIHNEVKQLKNKGVPAQYIPALAEQEVEDFGMSVLTIDQQLYTVGSSDKQFSIQSVSKLFSLLYALSKDPSLLGKRVGVEPSGQAFNSLVQLEHERGIPRNPFINAGALVVADHLFSILPTPKRSYLELMRSLSQNDDLNYDKVVAASERDTGYRNAALANFLKSFDNLQNDPEHILDLYYHQCALAVSCTDLVRAGFLLANQGVTLQGTPVLTSSLTKRLNALMLTCGMYDAVGNFAFEVGVPAKSGVGGGILAVIPGKMVIATYGPGLDQMHNSVSGVFALKRFTDLTECSIF